MRKLTIFVALAAVPSLSQAKRATRANHPPAHVDSRLAWVDDEPMSPTVVQPPHDPAAPSGTRMEVTIRAPEVGRAGDTGEAVSRAPSAPTRNDAGVASGGALDELIARQMRKNSASIEACARAATARKPTSNGTVELAVTVLDRKVKVHVASDTVRDIELDACLIKASQTWKLQLASATFIWPVTLSPSASR